jgi:hypothetical protein
MYSTLFAFKHSTNSRKSRLRGFVSGSLTNFGKNVNPLLWRHCGALNRVGRIRFLETAENSNGSFHALFLPSSIH